MQVYENIASHFSDTRHTAWPQVTNFLHSLEPYSLIADIGCGNGKYLAQSRSCYMVVDHILYCANFRTLICFKSSNVSFVI